MNKKTYIIAFITFLVDLIVKILVSNYMVLYKSYSIIKNFFYLTYVRNNGVAFSLLEDEKILILFITVIVLVFINFCLLKNKLNKLESVCYGLVIGGIVGNLFDRLIYGYVIDYFDFRFGSYNFAIFNLADSFIVVGAIILLIYNIRKDILNGRNKSK